jgi:hypothetical protein
MKLSFSDKIKILNMEIKHHVFDLFLNKNKKNNDYQSEQIVKLKEHFKQREIFFETLENYQAEKEKKNTTEELIKFNIIYDCIFSYNINLNNFEDNINKYEFKGILNSFDISKEEILDFIKLKTKILEIIEKNNKQNIVEEENYINAFFG